MMTALEFFERARWGNSPSCPRCAEENVKRLGGDAGQRGLWKCYGCLALYTVRTGTIMEGSRIDFETWRFVLVGRWHEGTALHCSREVGLSYKSTWAMLHVIRGALAQGEPWLKSLMDQSS